MNSKEDILNFIGQRFRLEANNLAFQYVDQGGIPIEAVQSAKIATDKIKQCNFEKECMIEAYEDYMDDWTSDKLRVMTRADYMTRTFGTIGDWFNKSMSSLY